MKVYLAAQYARRNEIASIAKKLENLGISVTSRWLQEDGNLDGKLTNSSHEINREYAARDLEDIDQCDELILFSEEPTLGIPRGARHVEVGYAIGTKKRVSVVGPRENVFHFLPQIEVYADIEAWLNPY